MERAMALYDSEMSLQAIGDELGLNPIKVRKLLITAGVYESEAAEKVKNTFEEWKNKILLFHVNKIFIRGELCYALWIGSQ